MRLENQGQLHVLEMPENWREQPIAREPLSSRRVRMFHPADNDKVQLRLIFRGGRETDEVGATLLRCLEQPAHVLEASELSALNRVLGDMSDASLFRIDSARTRDVKGRQVLWVEGNWLDQPYWMATIFVAADASGTLIQEISCFCDSVLKTRFQPVFDEILASAQWHCERA